MSSKRPRKPPNLCTAGGKLWDQITDPETGWDLRPDELRLLEDACRTADTIDVLEKALKTAQLTVKGSMGQIVAHPLLTEVRQHRGVLASLLGKLKLTDLDESSPVGDQGDGTVTPFTRSQAARKAANARWGKS
jgi:hypothetical protein